MEVYMNSNKLVKKSNGLITARYNLSVVEQKIILLIIAAVDRQDEDFKQYRFHIKDFFKLVEADSVENYTYIKNAFEGLLKKPIKIKDKDNWIICNWLSGAKITTAGIVDIEIYSGLRPYLIKLKEKFTSYKIKNILFLHSVYSIRVYELLKQFEKTKIKHIKIVEFREILNIPLSYETKHLKPYILEPARKELTEKTDITFTYKFIKEGRKFESIIFDIRQNGDSESEKKPQKKTKIKTITATAPTLQDMADSCLARGRCYDTPVIMSRCEVCANYNEKAKWIKENE